MIKALFGHALCEACLAAETGFARSVVRAALRSIESVLLIDAIRPCERCGTNINVRGVPEPQRPRLV